DESEYGIDVPVYKKSTHTGIVLEGKKYFPAWVLDEDDPMIRAALKTSEEILGIKPAVGIWGFSTNGVSTMGKHGIPTIGYGPGEEDMAHQPNERVSVEQLVAASLFYAYLPSEYCRARL
ncbi:MAG: M20/M25/M40 family metallo-hydrolase, partial [Candidatus Euphemobacter frigidus]|nr:M20/M25/M40 family metallo-hydrolase [Candidatus Euphemobacter frigidus]